MSLSKITRVLIAIGAISLAISSTAFAEFTDVKKAHPNYTAILYLQADGTLQGYEDGTFRPQNSVNRAEFLKIIIEGSNLATDIEENTPFYDVNHEAWYGPYIKKAYNAGWITGYEDGSFRPEQTINKVEALKITAKAQNWPINLEIITSPFSDTPADAWYTPYVQFAKDNNLLKLITPDIFAPGELMTRGQISEIIYRTKIEGIVENTNSPENPIPEEEEINEPDSPIIGGTIEKTFFTGITLSENLPDTFYKNEIYVLKGKSNTSVKEISIILENKTNATKQTLTTATENGNFEVPLFLSKSGNYQVGILNGSSGTTNAKSITVIETIPATNTETPPEKAKNLQIEFENDQTKISFSATANTLKKIRFSQGSEVATIYNRQNISEIPLTYSSFEDFSPGQVTYKVDLAKGNIGNTITTTSDFTSSDSKSFQATTHEFSIIETTDTNATPPETISSASSNIQFSGKTSVDINTRAFVITPEGKIENVTLTSNSPKSTYYSSEIILANGTYTFDYNPSINGTYIIEINNKNGQAIINHPVYIGNEIPFIPNYFDINPRKFFSGTFNLNSARNQLLDLINEDRERYDLNPVVLDDELNELAQAHSQDMVDKNYFAHVNLEGLNANDRRIAAGITTPVGENIAIDTGIINGHLALMRSAAHLRNIIEPSWTRVGIGIVAKDGYLTISEEFSSSEITEAEISLFKTELFEAINQARSNASAQTLILDNNLSEASASLNNKTEQEIELTNAIFTETLEQHSITGASQAIIRTYNAWQEIFDSIINEEAETTNDNSWQKIGIDILKSESGILYTTLILNTP